MSFKKFSSAQDNPSKSSPHAPSKGVPGDGQPAAQPAAKPASVTPTPKQ